MIESLKRLSLILKKASYLKHSDAIDKLAKIAEEEHKEDSIPFATDVFSDSSPPSINITTDETLILSREENQLFNMLYNYFETLAKVFIKDESKRFGNYNINISNIRNIIEKAKKYNLKLEEEPSKERMPPFLFNEIIYGIASKVYNESQFEIDRDSYMDFVGILKDMYKDFYNLQYKKYGKI